MKFRRRNLEALGELIVGNVGRDDPANEDEARYFPYRSSMYITEFFQELDTEHQHNGSTRHRWVADVLEQMLAEPHEGHTRPPEVICRLIDQLMSPSDRLNEGPDRPCAIAQLNEVLGREGFEAFYAEDSHCYLRHVGPQTVTVLAANPHRPFSKQGSSDGSSWRRTSIAAVRTNSSRRCCSRSSASSATTASRRRGIRTRRWSTARTFGCATPCRRSTSSTSACRRRRANSTRQA